MMTTLLMKDNKTVQLASRVIATIGREPRLEVRDGGSDANIFNEQKRETVNLAIGYEKIHTVYEYIPIEKLKKGSEMVLEIVQLDC